MDLVPVTNIADTVTSLGVRSILMLQMRMSQSNKTFDAYWALIF